jgi:hypothetical protein
MSALQQAAVPSGTAGPTPEHPEFGVIGMEGFALSNVAYWQEGGLHVFRSTEYDVIVADENKQVAIAAFAEQSEDYAGFLAEFADRTMEDLTISTTILRRLVDIYESAQAQRSGRLAIIRKLRGRGHDAAHGWHHEPTALT